MLSENTAILTFDHRNQGSLFMFQKKKNVSSNFNDTPLRFWVQPEHKMPLATEVIGTTKLKYKAITVSVLWWPL